MSWFGSVLDCILCEGNDERQYSYSNPYVRDHERFTIVPDRALGLYSRRDAHPVWERGKSWFVALLKCTLCEGDDEGCYSHAHERDPELFTTARDRAQGLYSRYNASPMSQSYSGVTNSSYITGIYRDPELYSTALDRDPELYSRRNALQKSQSNSGVTNSSYRTDNYSSPSQAKTTKLPNRTTTVQKSVPIQLSTDETVKSRASDAVSGTYSSKQPSIPSIPQSLSGDTAFNSIKSESPNPPPKSQVVKPPPITTHASKQSLKPNQEKISKKLASVNQAVNFIESESPKLPPNSH